MILAINRKAAVGLILTGIVLVILMFDMLFELVLELISVSFEFVEQMLDMLIEHIFHTDLRDTQVIVFYLMQSIHYTDCCALCLVGIMKSERILSSLGHS